MLRILPSLEGKVSRPIFESRCEVDAAHYFTLSYGQFGILAAFTDASSIVVTSILAGTVYHWLTFGRVVTVDEFFGIGAVFAALTIASMRLKGLYRPDSLLSIRPQIVSIIFIWSSVVLFFLGISFTLKISEDLSRGSMLTFALMAPLVMLSNRLALRRTMLAALQKGGLKRLKICLISQNPEGRVYEMLSGYEIVKRYFLPQDVDAIRDTLVNVVSTVRGSNIREVHLDMDWTRWADVKQILPHLRVLPVPLRLIADSTAHDILQYPQRKMAGLTSFELQRPPLSVEERAAKRAFDVFIATVCLVATAPVLLAISVAIRIESCGPVLFRQKRGGFNGRAFEILKFRTMRVMENGATLTQASRNDERVTRVGRWLRRSSFDELPQLINVLRGDMSLVGPRPHARAHDAQYSGLIASYPYRQYVSPGITGWAQINGFRGETPTISLMKQRVELDLWYVTNWSFWLDLRILLWTVLEVCRARNAC